MDLGEFLILNGRRRREAGAHDCCTFPAAWAMANGWNDPMAAWRGVYSTESEAAEVIEAAGGLAVLFACGMTSVGIGERHEAPMPGDIGVILVGQEAGAIFTGKRWAFVADRGLAFGSVESEAVVGLWAIHG